MTKKKLLYPALLLPVALCLLLGTADVALADCNFDESVVLVLEERRIDGKLEATPWIGIPAQLHGSGYGFTFYVVRDDPQLYENSQQCNSLFFQNTRQK